jgi:adenine deaminase
LETAPKITAEHAKNWIKNSNVVGLAEVMDDEGVLSGKNQNVLQMIRVTLQNRKIVDGHFSNCEQERLQAYIASGILTDHQAIRPEKVAELIKRGAWVMLNGGRLISGKDKKTRGLLDTVVREGLDIGHCMLCTDDRHAGDIHRYGLMDYNVTQAVRAFEHAGVGREEAFINSIRMATRNAAECYRLNMDIGTIAPGRTADIIEVKTNLKATKKQFIMKVKRVILDGKLVAKNGELLVKPTPYKYPSWATNSVKIKPSFNLNDLHVKPRKGRGHRSVAKVRISQGWHDFSRVNRIQQLPIENGYIKPDIKKDIVKVVVAERHGINGNTGVGFLHGTGLKRGAIATTLSHDSHNLTAIGIKDEDIFYAIRELTKMQGGMIVVENETVLAKLALPIAGLMTGNLRDAIGGQRRIRDAARALGLKPPFLREFGTTLGLTAYPGTGTKERTKWTITDKGLVEYPTCKMLQVVV